MLLHCRARVRNSLKNDIRKKSWEELGTNVDEESPYISPYKIIKETQYKNVSNKQSSTN